MCADSNDTPTALEQSRIYFAIRTAIAAGAYAVFAGILTILGWAVGSPRLTDWVGTGIAMFPNTAVCALLSGGGLILLARGQDDVIRLRAIRILAITVALIGGLTFFEHASGINLGIDTILSTQTWGQRAAASPMRMGPPASTSFLLLGMGFFLATAGPRARRFASVIASLAIAIASLSLIGYWFGADRLFTIVHLTGIALQTSTIIAAIAVGLMACLPERGLVALLCRDDAGGMLVRRLLLPITVIPVLIGWLVLLGRQAEYYDAAFGISIMLLSMISLLLGLLCWTAFGISHAAQAARRTQSELEDELRLHLAELAERDRRKTEFLATLAHELRNPLAPICSALQMLRIETPAGTETRRFLEIVERQVSYMVQLVDDLLELSRITSGKIELRHEPVDLAAVIQSAIETSKPLIEATRHRFTLSMPTEPLTVMADALRLSQVVANLLNNAAKYTEAGGTISLSVSRINGNVEISVKDTGIGISPDMLRDVFRMFSQAGRDHKRAQGGLGIGLALAKDLVEKQQGRIEARSEGEGRGSEFIVHLPLAAPQSLPAVKAPTPDQPAKEAKAGSRVLVVDDNCDATSSLAALLRMMGHEVQTANDGRAALEMFESFAPSLVLLDLGMPEMSGFEVAERIQSIPHGKQCVLVALTGWGQEEDRQRTMEAGFQGHLVKPVDLNTLRTLVAEFQSKVDRGAETCDPVALS